MQHFFKERNETMNNYIHVLDTNGKRITSIVIDILTQKEKALERAKSIAPDCVYIDGGDDMLGEFLSGKIYVNGKFIDAPVIEYIPTKAEQVAQIKNYYDKRFDALDKAVLRRRLANTDISDLQTQYKTLQAEMVAKIKGVA